MSPFTVRVAGSAASASFSSVMASQKGAESAPRRELDTWVANVANATCACAILRMSSVSLPPSWVLVSSGMAARAARMAAMSAALTFVSTVTCVVHGVVTKSSSFICRLLTLRVAPVVFTSSLATAMVSP